MAVLDPGTIRDGTEHLARGDVLRAEQVALAHLARGEDPDALHLVALVRIRQNRLPEALLCLDRSLAARSRHSQVLLCKGKVLALLKRDAEAAAAIGEAVAGEPGLVEAWHELGEAQIRLGQPELAETSFRNVLALEPGHLLAQLSLGALLRGLGRSREAQALLAAGLQEARDPRLKADFACNLAQAQYEQGRKDEALANFTLARNLDPARSGVEISRTDLLEELGRQDEAEAALEALLQREPQNEEAHAALNELMYRLKRDQRFLTSYDRVPATAPLQLGKAGFLFRARRFAEAEEIYAAVGNREPGNLAAVIGLASARNQLGRHDAAMAALEDARRLHPASVSLIRNQAATALQARDAAKAAALAEQCLRLAPVDHFGLALLGSAWRMLGDERDEMLNGYDELIGIFDMETPEGFASMPDFNIELSRLLDSLHATSREPINQSLRGGSQTRGNIFNEGHDLVERLKRRIGQAMDAYIATIRPDARHPFRGRATGRYRFTGSWSSRLKGGYHINHVHPEGWISSCYYVGVPEAVKDESQRQGWIKFGEPSMETGLLPRRSIQPRPGRLVLFPSYMWHGTIPFEGAVPRTTIAFDALPR